MNHLRRFGATLDSLSGNRAPLRHVSAPVERSGYVVGHPVSRTSSLGNPITSAFEANAARDVAMSIAHDGRPHYSLPRNVPDVRQRNRDAGRNIVTAMRYAEHMSRRRPLALTAIAEEPMEVEEIDL